MECTHGAAKDTIENDRNGLGGWGGNGVVGGELHVRLSAKEEEKSPRARNEHSAALCCRASFLGTEWLTSEKPSHAPSI